MQRLLLIIVTQPLFKSAPTCLGLFMPQTSSIPLYTAAASDVLGGGWGREGVVENKWGDAGARERGNEEARERVDVMTAISVCSTWSCPPPRLPPLSLSPSFSLKCYSTSMEFFFFFFSLKGRLVQNIPLFEVLELESWSVAKGVWLWLLSSRGSAESHITQLELGPW